MDIEQYIHRLVEAKTLAEANRFQSTAKALEELLLDAVELKDTVDSQHLKELRVA